MAGQPPRRTIRPQPGAACLSLLRPVDPGHVAVLRHATPVAGRRLGEPDIDEFARRFASRDPGRRPFDLRALPAPAAEAGDAVRAAVPPRRAARQDPAAVVMAGRVLAVAAAECARCWTGRGRRGTSASTRRGQRGDEQLRSLLSTPAAGSRICADGGGWEAEFPRDVWRAAPARHRRPQADCASTASRSPGCGSWPNGWLRWRLGTGLSCRPARTSRQALTRFARFLATPAGRRHRLAGSTGPCWNATWPTCTPTRARRQAPRRADRLAQRVPRTRSASTAGTPPCPPARCSSPTTTPSAANACPARWPNTSWPRSSSPTTSTAGTNPAGRLVTLILMRCGLRVGDALKLPRRLHRPRRRRRPLPALLQPQDETRGAGPDRRGARARRSPSSSSGS